MPECRIEAPAATLADWLELNTDDASAADVMLGSRALTLDRARRVPTHDPRIVLEIADTSLPIRSSHGPPYFLIAIRLELTPLDVSACWLKAEARVDGAAAYLARVWRKLYRAYPDKPGAPASALRRLAYLEDVAAGEEVEDILRARAELTRKYGCGARGGPPKLEERDDWPEKEAAVREWRKLMQAGRSGARVSKAHAAELVGYDRHSLERWARRMSV